MAFPDPVVAGDKLVVPSIESADWVDGGTTGWQVNRDGSASFNNMNLAGDLTADSLTADTILANTSLLLPDGTDLVATIPLILQKLQDLEFGVGNTGRVVAAWTQTDSPLLVTGAFADTRIIGCDWIATAGHMYWIYARTNWTPAVSTDKWRYFVRLRHGDVGGTYPVTPVATDTAYTQTATTANPDQTELISAEYIVPWGTTDQYARAVLTINRLTGTGNIQQQGIGTGYADTRMVVFDMGAIDSSALLPLNFNGYNSTDTPPPAPPPAQPKTYTKTYYATWSRTYDGNNSTTWDDSAYCYQGYYSSTRGNTKSLAGFNYSQIQSDTSGAVINSCYLTIEGAHAYYNSGYTVEIGTHSYTAKPSTWAGGSVNENRLSSASLAAGTTRKISLGTTIGGEFKSGTSKGISFGPGPSTSLTYYGYCYGATQSGKPYLTITYTK